MDIPLFSGATTRKQPILKSSVKDVVIVFTDLVGFSALFKSLGRTKSVDTIEDLFQQFDSVAESLGLSPLKTNGDEYILTSLPPVGQQSALTKKHDFCLSNALRNAISFAQLAQIIVEDSSALAQANCAVRIGISFGDVTTGFQNRKYGGFDVWGECVNRAALLEQATKANSIAICESTFNALSSIVRDQFSLTSLTTKAEKVNAYVYEPCYIDISDEFDPDLIID